MLGRLINKDQKIEKPLTSWYDLSKKEAAKLEKEFISHDMGRDASNAMHICIIIGVIILVIATIILEVLGIIKCLNPYNFTVMILFILSGVIIVLSSTIEYHKKFNSWLKVKHNIIKK